MAPELTAEQILEKSAAAYLALKSYEGTTTVNNTIDTGGMKFEQTATAKITFARPGKIRIEGKTGSMKSFGLGGRPYTIVSNGNTAWSSEENEPFGKINLESAIAGRTGVALRAPTVVPSALLKLEWQYPFDAAIKAASELRGREKVGENECYKIIIKSPTLNLTYWIDTQTFLLRQLKEGKRQRIAIANRSQKSQTFYDDRNALLPR